MAFPAPSSALAVADPTREGFLTMNRRCDRKRPRCLALHGLCLPFEDNLTELGLLLPLLGFVRSSPPSALLFESTPRQLAALRPTVAKRRVLVRPRGLVTTSTDYASKRPADILQPAPTMGFTPFLHPLFHMVAHMQNDTLPRRATHPSKNSPHRQPRRVAATLCPPGLRICHTSPSPK